jgi:hypothetical protein
MADIDPPSLVLKGFPNGNRERKRIKERREIMRRR